jgi:peptidoglycan/xylan/chitin deacetylase (PgdA/CDA1 family)
MSGRKITVVFRYDDYSATSGDEVDEAVIGAFARHGMSCTFGVIPFVTTGNFRDPSPCETLPLTDEKVRLLSRAVANGTVDVALHGCIHRTVQSEPPHSEFAGESVAAQAEKIARGKVYLEERLGVRADVFVPPWNSYDRDTLTALQQAGLSCIAANRYGAVDRRLRTQFLPITIELPDVQRAVNEARESSDPEPIVGVLMHPYDFRESGDSRAELTGEDLGRELAWLAAQADVRVVSIGALIAEGADLSVERFIANTPPAIEAVAPPFIKRTASRAVYGSLVGARALRRVNQYSIAGFYLAVAAVAVIAGYMATLMLGWLSEELPLIAAAVVAVSFAATLGRVVMKRRLAFRAALVSAAIAGLLIGQLMGTR